MNPNSTQRLWAGFDLGGTKMMAALFNARFEMLESQRVRLGNVRGSKAVTAQMIALVRQVLRGAMRDARGRLSGIGLGVPGPLDLDRGIVLEAPNLGWKNVALRRILEQTFRCPVVLANDVDAGTFGEYRFGAARNARCAVGIFPGTGIGGGCVYEGRLIRGKTGSCMEIGHIQVQPRGPLCGCGRRGCLEAVASRLAICAEAAAAAYRGQAPHILKRAGTDLREIRSKTLAAAIREGDFSIEQIMRHAARQIGTAAASVVNLLAPDTVVLGGGLVEAMPKLFLREVRDVVRRDAMKGFTKGLRVMIAQLGDEATVMGAAALAAERVCKTAAPRPLSGNQP
ncbi:MAG: ROK family protein [Verrucomicrobia bacterium]|nr:ROK family protein [Verrucomicrobiota bacterium]